MTATFHVARDDGKPVTKESHTRQVWEFWLNDRLELILDAWYHEERPSPRHKWRVTTLAYSRLWPRRCSLRDDRQVPLPMDVKQEALRLVLERLKVVRWSELQR